MIIKVDHIDIINNVIYVNDEYGATVMRVPVKENIRNATHQGTETPWIDVFGAQTAYAILPKNKE
jgi:hypothetical protein